MKSLISKHKYCFYCGNPNIHKHHIFEGVRHRSLSEKYGCWVYLCPYHHNLGGKECIHQNKEMDDAMKDKCQRAFEKEFPNLNFMDIFHKNYKKEG